MNSPPYTRRRLGFVGAIAGLAIAVPLIASTGDDEPGPSQPERGKAPEPAAHQRPLREQVGEVILMRFNGTRVPGYVQRVLRRKRATGVTLFTFNATSPTQLRTLTRQLEGAAGGDALIAVDQEGGIARRLRWASPSGQASQATPDAAAGASSATAKALRAGGINLNFAPVADVASGSGSAVRSRAYPGGSDEVSATTAAAVRAYEGTGVAPTLKHFPGFGRATANTDDAPVTIDASRAELATDLAPFRAGIAAGAPVIMVSHALYPAYDGAWIASQSRPIVTDLLRGELGFKGVIATDSMEADAVLSRSSVEDAAVYAIYAGCDLLVLTGRASQLPVYERLLDEAKRSPEFRARIEESAGRVRALKRELGLPR
jgi:beta-N-acetylhexosaminidase